MTMLPKVYLGVQNRDGEWVERPPLVLYPKDQIGSVRQSIYEFQALRFRFESANPEDELWVEKFDGDSFQVVRPGESLEVKKRGDADSMLVPGEYPVLVKTAAGTYETLYRIQPSNMSWDQLMNLRTYLEQKMTGLAYNVLRWRSGSFGSESDPVHHALKVYHHIQRNFNKLRHQLESIMRDPIQDVIQVYGERKYSRKPDMKSQRWLSKRGSVKNANISSPTYFFEKHTELTADTLENRWIKFILRKTVQELKQVQRMYESSRTEQKSRLAKKMAELRSYKERMQRIGTQYGFDDRRKELRKLIYHNEQELAQLQDGLRKIDQHLEEAGKYIAQFSRYEQAERLANVRNRLHHKKPTLRLLKDPRYGGVYRFYKGMETLQQRTVSSTKMTFPYKKTSLLFEYYVLCLVIEILQESGFLWTEGWLADYEHPELAIGELSSETLMRFEHNKGDAYIELAYDTQILNSGDQSASHFIANVKRAPDIRISLYRNNGDFLSAIILDAKYRRFEYLWNDVEENDVMKQLNDYLRIWYFDVNKSGRLRRDAVSKVVAVYPRQPNAAPFVEKMV